MGLILLFVERWPCERKCTLQGDSTPAFCLGGRGWWSGGGLEWELPRGQLEDSVEMDRFPVLEGFLISLLIWSRGCPFYEKPWLKTDPPLFS